MSSACPVCLVGGIWSLEMYLFRLENDRTTLLVDFFGKHGDVHASWSLIVIDPTVDKFLRLREVGRSANHILKTHMVGEVGKTRGLTYR